MVGEVTGIAWCDHTFNPWIGCTKISPGCAHCYAEVLSTKYRKAQWGDDATRSPAAESTWRNPVKWDKAANRDGIRRKVFCASLADVFEPRLELDPLRWRLMELIEATPNLDWLLLTKRPDYARAFLSDGRQATPDEVDNGYEFGWVPPWYYDNKPILHNLWLGTSIENSRFTWRADELRQLPAVIRFISAEPLLGSLFRESAPLPMEPEDSGCGCGAYDCVKCCPPQGREPLNLTGIDWVIIGGESGPQARPFNVAHCREIMYACREHPGRPKIFVKQMGAKPWDGTGSPMKLKHRKGEDMDEWPEDLRVQEFPA